MTNLSSRKAKDFSISVGGKNAYSIAMFISHTCRCGVENRSLKLAKVCFPVCAPKYLVREHSCESLKYGYVTALCHELFDQTNKQCTYCAVVSGSISHIGSIRRFENGL